MGGVVAEATRKGEVAGSNPIGRVARDFYAKNTRLATSTETGGCGLFFSIFLNPNKF
jgi:hypothetical protein